MEHSSSTRNTQRSRILELLIDARGSWVPLPEILELQISQYGARILELRRMGFIIENRREGEQSWFRLVPGPESTLKPKRVEAKPAPDSLFGDISPEVYPH
jgi:Helix-turn-helix domain